MGTVRPIDNGSISDVYLLLYHTAEEMADRFVHSCSGTGVVERA